LYFVQTSPWKGKVNNLRLFTKVLCYTQSLTSPWKGKVNKLCLFTLNVLSELPGLFSLATKAELGHCSLWLTRLSNTVSSKPKPRKSAYLPKKTFFRRRLFFYATLSFVLHQGLFLKILLYKCVITISKPTPTKDT
jgi:hypothetical protein